MAKYLNDWAGGGWRKTSGRAAMIEDFSITPKNLEGADILIASYTNENYEGYAYVLFRRGRHLFEVHGSHCSCYGLEGQWQPEQTTKTEIMHRVKKGTWGEESRIKDAVLAALK